MNALREIVLRIPAESRKWITDTNAIYKAIANASDPHMVGLFTIWQTYVEPNSPKDMNCGICVANILKNFKDLQDTFVAISKEDKLLEL